MPVYHARGVAHTHSPRFEAAPSQVTHASEQSDGLRKGRCPRGVDLWVGTSPGREWVASSPPCSPPVACIHVCTCSTTDGCWACHR